METEVVTDGLDDRMQWRRAIGRRARRLEDLSGPSDSFAESKDVARLAQARFAGQHDDAPLPRAGHLPQVQEGRDARTLFDELRGRPGSALHTDALVRDAEDLVRPDRRQALDLSQTQIEHIEAIPDQLSG